mmetsp:Transcript_4495/g.4667  ORF Transcript_4495/g.4667 Transcript_4495/m.4667 type:complete len:357 (+) Transcript_4495:11-1081(+)
MVEANTTTSNMIYRYLGNTGIRVSVLSWGNWVNGKSNEHVATIKAALEAGVNFFDTAEIYNFGEAEVSLGHAFKELKVRRESIVVTTKIFKVGMGVNDTMLSRKHILEGVSNSLKRLQLDYVDVLFCHRFDDITPLEEVCRAMNQAIQNGQAFYWATSEWKASQIAEAYAICDRLGLIRPIADQCQYNMMVRDKVENEYTHLFDKHSMGTTVWSPLYSGVLTGKYKEKIVEGSRFDAFAAESSFHRLKYLNQKDTWDAKIVELTKLAKTLGDYSMPQLALAWVIRNPNVSTCIMGTSKVEQFHENIKALDLAKKIDLEVEAKIEKILGNGPDADIDWRTFTPKDTRRVGLIKNSKL